MQNETNQGRKIWSLVLDRVEKWAILSQTGSQVLKASATHLYLNFPWNPHPPPPPAPEYTNQKMNNGVRGGGSAYERGGDAHRLA